MINLKFIHQGVNMKIRYSTFDDIDTIMAIFDSAKQFMKEIGNPDQWSFNYPSYEIVREDIHKNQSYIVEDDNGEIVATFVFFIDNDPTYAFIEGEWLNNEPYGVIHRIASTGKIKRISDYCINWCFEKCHNLRVDTHAQNSVMKEAFLRNNFKECGIIFVRDKQPRVAFQKIQ